METVNKSALKFNRRREMECAVCLDRLRQPKMLSCAHNFCRTCLEGLVWEGKILCPSCRTETTLGPDGVGDLPKNVALINIMETLCEQCLDKDRELRCEHCDLWMCATCHLNCKQKQKYMRKGKIVLVELDSQENRIDHEMSKVNRTIDLVRSQIQSREKTMIEAIQQNAAILMEELKQEENKQVSLSKDLKKYISRLRKDISKKIDDDRLKDTHVTEDDIELSAARWRNKLKICTTKFSRSKRTIKFITGRKMSTFGELDISKPQRTSQMNYERAQFELLTFEVTDSILGEFNFPSHVAISPVSKKMFVVNRGNNIVNVYNERDELVSMFGCEGVSGLAVTDTDLIVVADSNNHRLRIFAEHGTHVKSIGSKGSFPGQLNGPEGLTISNHLIYVCDRGNSRIQVFDIEGKYVRQFGSKSVFGNTLPYDVTITKTGCVIVSSVNCTTNAGMLAVFSANENLQASFAGDITGAVKLHRPHGVTTDGTDKYVIVSDFETSVIHILTASGGLLRTLGFDAKGKGQLSGPMGVVCTTEGDIIVANYYSHCLQKYKLV